MNVPSVVGKEKDVAVVGATPEVVKVNSKVTLKTKSRMAGLKVRKVRSKLLLSVPSSEETERLVRNKKKRTLSVNIYTISKIRPTPIFSKKKKKLA